VDFICFFLITNFGRVQKGFQLINIYPNNEVIITTSSIFCISFRNMPNTGRIQILFRATCQEIFKKLKGSVVLKS